MARKFYQLIALLNGANSGIRKMSQRFVLRYCFEIILKLF